MMSRTALVFDVAGYRHTVPDGHPENPNRLRAIEDAFAAAKLDPPRLAAREATREELVRVHLPEHVEVIKNTCEDSAPYPDADTHMVPGSWRASLLAAGGAIEACEAVLAGKYKNVFCAMRPPGHHAEADHAMGFCLFNSVAIAARALQSVHGVERIAIFDWDVHHGNGTQHSTYTDPGIYYFSMHQYPHYPGTGRPEERGADNTNLNLCMRPGASAKDWMVAFREEALPELERFDPQFLLISAGFDAHRLDPLGNQNLEAEHYIEMTRALKEFANGRVVSLLEGGYNLEALGESAVAHFQELQRD